ncbi:MAG: hypothetical protein JSW45_09785 [Thiotrichales bacterium]|nr:MAG: hypothetical protein JSW45_09785 [Thiotrichales bacterium]
MDEETFNMNVRKFLKRVGVSSQRQIESAIRQALANGKIDQDGVCKVSMQLSIDCADEPFVVEGEISLS